MKTLTYFTLTTLGCITLAACSNKNSNEQEDAMPDLYKKSVQLTQLYIDSLSHATDSATVHLLMEHYDAAAAALNMKYPRGTDMAMTPDRNDTLFALSQRLINARDKALATPVDTLGTDTINNIQPERK